jgi:hypothetical protein
MSSFYSLYIIIYTRFFTPYARVKFQNPNIKLLINTST